MASDPKTIIDSWEAAFQAKRELVGNVPADKLGKATDNAGWTVRNLATHLAMGSDGFLGMVAPKLSAGKNFLPVPVPTKLWTIIGNVSNGRDAKKHAKASPADLVRVMNEAHEKCAKKLSAVPTDGWDRKGLIPTLGRLTLAEFVEQIVAHDQEHAEVLKKAIA